MRPIYIGTFKLGAENVRLQMTEGGGGAFYSCPDTKEGESACIEVGVAHDYWWQVFGVLTHEAMEFSFFRSGLRYTMTPDYANDNGSYLFVMDHFQFSEASARAAMFLSESAPMLKKAWEKHRATKRRIK